MASNVDILTRSHAIIKAKARAKRSQIDQIIFDDEARHEYLTGFRKRNLQKKEAAKNRAKEREHKERLQTRREQRQALQEQARENAQLIEKAFRKHGDGNSDDEVTDEDEFSGFSSSEKGKGRATQEYEDEEQLTTVTVVEEFDAGALRHFSWASKNQNDGSEVDNHDEGQLENQKTKRSIDGQISQQNRKSGASHEISNVVKVKPKKVAYESNAARKAARLKQRARKLEKAELAGGRRKDRGKGNKKRGKGK